MAWNIRSWKGRSLRLLGDLVRSSAPLLLFSVSCFVFFLLAAYRTYADLPEWLVKVFPGGQMPTEKLALLSILLVMLYYLLAYRLADRLPRHRGVLLHAIPWVILGVSVLFGLGYYGAYTRLLISLVVVTLGLVILTARSTSGRDVADAFLAVLCALGGSVVLGLIAFGLVAGMATSLSYILWGKEGSTLLMYWCALPTFLLSPIFYRFFCYECERGGNTKVLSFVLNTIFLPAFIGYCVILLIYLLKLLLTLSYPEGTVGWLMIGLYLLGLLAMAGVHYRPNALNRWVYKAFRWIMIPVIALAVWAIGVRIGEYGWTQLRVYYFVAIAVMVVTTVASFVKLHREYISALAGACVGLVVFTLIPGISAQEIGYQAQVNRFLDFAREMGIVHADGGLYTSREVYEKYGKSSKEVKEIQFYYTEAARQKPEGGADRLEGLMPADNDLYLRRRYILPDEEEQGIEYMFEKPFVLPGAEKYTCLLFECKIKVTETELIVMYGEDEIDCIPKEALTEAYEAYPAGSAEPLVISRPKYDLCLRDLYLRSRYSSASAYVVGWKSSDLPVPVRER